MYYSGWTVGKTFSKDELEKIAKEKLNEDPNRREADIRSIKDWMSKQPHLKDHGRKGNINLFQFSLLNYFSEIIVLFGCFQMTISY